MSESLVRRGPGRPKGTSTLEVIQLRKMTRATVDAVFAELMQNDMKHLDNLLANPDAPMLHLIVAKVIKQAFTTGDARILDFILDRTIGKVREAIDVDMVVAERIRKHDELLRIAPQGKLMDMIRVDQKAPRDDSQ